jgi:AraC family transcriptional regulator, L-rhamnose operon transcriptional activator RhaR
MNIARFGAYPGAVIEDMPMDTSQPLFHFNEDALAYAGYHRHDDVNPLHCHSFVEIAFVAGGQGVHLSRAGGQSISVGDVILLRPGVWHGYEQCRQLTLYNCCFTIEVLRRELAWTREDPMLGYLLWTGPYSANGHGMMTIHLDPGTFEECRVHLAALTALRHTPVAQYRGDVIGRLALLLGILGRAVAAMPRLQPDPPKTVSPAIGHAMRLLETRLAERWTLTQLAEELHLAPGYLVRLFKSATGLPPMAYLARLRAEHAANLLLRSDESIAGIGRTVGWPDQNYFARRFRAHYGLTASSYRARFAQQAEATSAWRAARP